MDKPPHAHAQGKNNASNNTSKKRKPPYVQGHKGDNNKKSKGTKGLLSINKLERRDYVFFACGITNVKIFPVLKRTKARRKQCTRCSFSRWLSVCITWLLNIAMRPHHMSAC